MVRIKKHTPEKPLRGQCVGISIILDIPKMLVKRKTKEEKVGETIFKYIC